jgi:hypothetical protein
MILILFSVIIDCIGKSFNIGAWYASFPIAIVLIFYVLVINYECKNILELSLVDKPNGYTSVSFGELISLHDKIVVQRIGGTTGERRQKRSGGAGGVSLELILRQSLL